MQMVVPHEEDPCVCSTFVVHYNPYHCKMMPIGLINAPSTFQQTNECILKDELLAHMYLDDEIIFSHAIEKRSGLVYFIVKYLYKDQCKLQIEKCTFYRENLELLGHTVSHKGVLPGYKEVHSIRHPAGPS